MGWINLYVLRVLLALDQLANALAFGSHRQTISQRAALSARGGSKIGCVICKILNFFHKDHCEKSLDPDYSKGPKP